MYNCHYNITKDAGRVANKRTNEEEHENIVRHEENFKISIDGHFSSNTDQIISIHEQTSFVPTIQCSIQKSSYKVTISKLSVQV